MSEPEPPIEQRRVQRFPNAIVPTNNDVEIVVRNLQKRMDIYELTDAIKNISMEDAAKISIMRGYPTIFVSRETRETHETYYEGFIFKHAVSIPQRIVKETRIFSAGAEHE